VTGGCIRLESLSKSYGDAPAVRGIDLEIAAGEFFSLLGPSGCGKTSTLRMIAGFEPPSGGRILLDGADLVAVPANRRPVNTVFQNYALFPHLSVRDNVGFGLRYARLSSSELHRRADDALAMVRMSPFAGRRPVQLSGGQQQRVALARALVLNPRVLLLDEPLGALDAKLRRALQLELKALQEQVGITFVYVTHDQEEALTMSDRLAVMSGGRIEQVGTPSQVYAEPSNAYVADFLGAANVWDVEVLGPAGDGRTRFRFADRELVADGPAHEPGKAKLVARPERLRLCPPDADAAVPGLVDRTVYRGATADLVVRLADGSTIVLSAPGDVAGDRAHGEQVSVLMPAEALRLLPEGGGPAHEGDVSHVNRPG
jgi:spermidine/putrescine transport system ATP-binding protein